MILYHGTKSNFSQFKGLTYLSPIESEAAVYAIDAILDKRGDTSRLLTVNARPGPIRNINREVEDAVMNGEDVDEVIAFLASKYEGSYRYMTFMHPGVSTDEFKVYVSLHPGDLTVIKEELLEGYVEPNVIEFGMISPQGKVIEPKGDESMHEEIVIRLGFADVEQALTKNYIRYLINKDGRSVFTMADTPLAMKNAVRFIKKHPKIYGDICYDVVSHTNPYKYLHVGQKPVKETLALLQRFFRPTAAV